MRKREVGYRKSTFGFDSTLPLNVGNSRYSRSIHLFLLFKLSLSTDTYSTTRKSSHIQLI